MTRTDHFDYELPAELIAQEPLAQRSDARLLVVDRRSGELSHRYVRDLPELIRPTDALVLNDTRVVPARLLGRRAATGGRWEGLFLRADEAGHWWLLCKTRGKLQPGERITLEAPGTPPVSLYLISRLPWGGWLARPEIHEPTVSLLERLGRVPLPCYIRGGQMLESDRTRYQTVFAREPGAVAAPTAGLHFTPALLERLRGQGVEVSHVTLHVGLDTFRPIATDEIEAHPMHSEWGRITADTAARLAARRAAGGRIVAVGTTSVRVLETAAAAGALAGWEGETRLFIRPGHVFRAVDVLLTNFHLPRSTLLVLVSALAGEDLIRRAYAEAIRERYRFYSYGDAMLIV
ncbi:MAG: tRNA preQ1(34) S-adenosylmethionine ribosyltransferase-isomerase QueA [Pirellulales bacterium]